MGAVQSVLGSGHQVSQLRSLWAWYVKRGLDVMMFFLVFAIGFSFLRWVPLMIASVLIATVSLVVSLKFGKAGEDGGS